MTYSQASTMLSFIKKEGAKFNESDSQFIDRIERMPAMGFLSSQDEARVRYIYEKKTRNLSGSIV